MEYAARGWKLCKMNKKTNLSIFITLVYIISIIAYVIAFGQAIYLIMVGFHNLDQGQNLRYLETELNVTIMDTANDFVDYNTTEMYVIGVNQLENGVKAALLTFGGLMFTLGILSVVLVGSRYGLKSNNKN
jgi:hypothetical protein